MAIVESALVVGCGSIGHRHLRLLLAGGLAGEVRGCEPDAATRLQTGEEFPAVQMFSDYREALAAGPTAVVLCTPPNMHVDQALAALEAGCHVL